ncbi:MAG TPA: phage baseplate assembly protein V [Accumulibacter sp.]|nr:phage baseplate assembly protein V [Accumulibacter sp.]HMX23237.1 phage baseplate assembly protein V [Accumulibacter sp.]HNG38627.1 phage baseplate assembly protein V [Accumulibacter sp.]HNL13858.1 phage baseplate assembly protein V [Accumulibacter sp.]
MQRVVHTIRQIARQEAQQQLAPALGIVGALYADGDYACTVTLRESGLVLPRVPIASGLIGWVAPPQEGDLVVVVFLGGEANAPVIVGRLYDERTAPPSSAAGQAIAQLPHAVADAAQALRLTVETPDDGSRCLTLTLAGSVQVELQIDDESISLRTQDARLRLSQSGGSDGKAELVVGGSQVTIEQSGDVSVVAEGTLKLKARQIELAADGEIKIAGQVINVN